MSALYVVATPIGNLEDLSARVIRILGEVDLITAEDTRRTGLLLKHLGLETPMLSVHDHNEKQLVADLIKRLHDGTSIALVSDAGTPLISDPGFHFVEHCHVEGIPVIPIAGPSAVTAALSAAGVATDRFSFEGFVPAKEKARLEYYQRLSGESRTLVFFEAPHRISQSLESLEIAMGPERQMSICRELTKTFEQIVHGSVSELRQAVESGDIPAKGEFVLVLARSPGTFDADVDRLLLALLPELSPSKAASVVAKLTTESKSVLYDRALQLKG